MYTTSIAAACSADTICYVRVRMTARSEKGHTKRELLFSTENGMKRRIIQHYKSVVYAVTYGSGHG